MKQLVHITFLMVAAACNRTPSDQGEQTSANAPAPAVQASGERRMMKQYQFTSTERLGTLPEGVGIPAGEPAPDAAVKDAEGHQVRLRDLSKDGPILLVFYRGGWCPFCNFQIRELTTAYPEYQRRGIRPVAVSVDLVEESARTQATYTIPFPVLSDPDLAAHRAFRVVHQADDAEVARLKGSGMDLEHSSGRTHHMIAVPSLFVIDREGIVRWAHADPDYKVRPSTEQILAAIAALDLHSN
jgi:peroxiredoxin